jgi:uncharacterized protein (TIGR01619 family)
MEENWIAYFRMIDNSPAVIGVDLAYAENGPDEERPTAVQVTLGFLETQENGLPQGDEFEKLERVEDELLAAMATTGAVFIGRRSHGGQREFFFYGPRGDAARAAAAGVVDGYADREPSVDIADDAEWEFYFEELLPDVVEMRRVLDEMVIEQLVEAGDPLNVPRPVSHFIYFPDAASRDAFASSAADAGFTTEAFDDDEPEPEDEDERYGVKLDREDAVDLDSINEVTTDLTLAAEEAGGRYDGWEAMVVQDGEGGEEGEDGAEGDEEEKA